jgi:hypothetical protein
MAHIHTEPGQHDFTASAYIVRIDTPEPALLLHLHKKLRKYLQFGGHVELNEDPWQALVHELAEESGYSMNQLMLLQPKLRLKRLTGTKLHPSPVYIQTHDFPGLDHYHIDIAFAFTTSEEPGSKIGEGESLDIRTFTLTELKALPQDEILENVRETGIFILKECLKEWEPVKT